MRQRNNSVREPTNHHFLFFLTYNLLPVEYTHIIFEETNLHSCVPFQTITNAVGLWHCVPTLLTLNASYHTNKYFHSLQKGSNTIHSLPLMLAVRCWLWNTIKKVALQLQLQLHPHCRLTCNDRVGNGWWWRWWWRYISISCWKHSLFVSWGVVSTRLLRRCVGQSYLRAYSKTNWQADAYISRPTQWPILDIENTCRVNYSQRCFHFEIMHKKTSTNEYIYIYVYICLHVSGVIWFWQYP